MIKCHPLLATTANTHISLSTYKNETQSNYNLLYLYYLLFSLSRVKYAIGLYGPYACNFTFFFNYAPENHDNRLVNEKYIRDFCQVMRFQTKDLVF